MSASDGKMLIPRPYSRRWDNPTREIKTGSSEKLSDPNNKEASASLSRTDGILPQVHWTSECEKAFQSLKEALCSRPILRSPDLDKEFILQTDASDRGVGAVLSQFDID